MIKTQELTPSYYYNTSRDFQLLGRIYDVVFNYIKSNIDTISTLPLSENSPLALVDLLCTTVGFKRIHDYTSRELKALCSVFPYILRNKGSLKSIELVISILCRVNNIKDTSSISIDSNDPWNLIIYIPSSIADYTLLLDVFDYILPVGMTYSIIRTSFIEYDTENISKYSDSYTSVQHDGTNASLTNILPKRTLINNELDLTNRNSNMVIRRRESTTNTTKEGE